MKKATKKSTSKKKKSIIPKNKKESRSVRIEKAENGFIISQTISTEDSYTEKKVIARTNKEAQNFASKLL